MTWVKICGITNLEDAQIAVEAGADAVGFVFYPKSVRNIGGATVRAIARELPAEVERVGVFVGDIPETFHDLMRDNSLTGMQMHSSGSIVSSGSKANGIVSGRKVYIAISASLFIEHQDATKNFVSSLERVSEALRALPGGNAPFEAIFLDSGNLQQPGGTGEVFDWRKALPVVEQMKRTVNVVVAGGLTPTNVTEAMHILKPWGVDVSSGVESKPGKKDPEKVRAFISAVRQADASK